MISYRFYAIANFNLHKTIDFSNNTVIIELNELKMQLLVAIIFNFKLVEDVHYVWYYVNIMYKIYCILFFDKRKEDFV